jgi:hypothetical protein
LIILGGKGRLVEAFSRGSLPPLSLMATKPISTSVLIRGACGAGIAQTGHRTVRRRLSAQMVQVSLQNENHRICGYLRVVLFVLRRLKSKTVGILLRRVAERKSHNLGIAQFAFYQHK